MSWNIPTALREFCQESLRVGARSIVRCRRVEAGKFILKIWGCSWCRVDHVGMFKYQNWAMYEKLFLKFRLCTLNNVYSVTSHIGEAYLEDERSQARRGGYDPAIYQWVGSLFSVHTYIYCYFSQKMIWDAMQVSIYFNYALVLAYNCDGAADAQVSIR